MKACNERIAFWTYITEEGKGEAGAKDNRKLRRVFSASLWIFVRTYRWESPFDRRTDTGNLLPCSKKFRMR